MIKTISIFVAALALTVPANTLAQSLWHDETSRPMFADKRATGVGDIITIVVSETSSASKNNATKTEKNSSLTAAIASFLYSPGASGLLTKKGQLPAIKYDADIKHDGGGSINNTETVVAKIAVRIVDVLPNRNLVVEGRRETAFSGEKQTIVLRGTVRQDDVASDNTVFSYNVADATIQIIGKGTVSDTQRKGWFTRIWDKLTPF